MTAEALTLPGLLRRNAAQCGDRPAIVTEAGAITHSGLEAESAALAARLVAAGLRTSSRVGLLTENGIEWIVIAAAVMRSGAVLVPLSTLLQPPELLAQLQTAGVTELIATRSFRGRDYRAELESVAPGVGSRDGAGRRSAPIPNLRQVWTADDLPGPTVEPAFVVALGEAVRPGDDMVILFTSGSRGTPKGVIHTHGGGIRATASGLSARRVGSDERLYIPMPFSWAGGFSSGLMTVLVAGATLITEAVPDPEHTLELLEREKVTLFGGWPDQAARLAAHSRFASTDLRHLREASLPAVLPPDIRPRPGARANLFGMTETFGPYCGDRLDTDLPPAKQGSCGRPFEGFEVRILDPDSGEECPAGTAGEVGIRGPNVMRGICGRTRMDTFDADGFYHTGDLGVLDADGYLWFRGRLDDMFKVRGATVYPSAVEEARRAVKGVRPAFVTNVPSPTGEQAGAQEGRGLPGRVRMSPDD